MKMRPDEAMTYHCMSRTVAGEHLFGDQEKEVLRKQIWRVADFCGVQVLTYCVMANHFHVLVRVTAQEKETVSDAELVRRFAVLYPERGCGSLPYGCMAPEELAALLASEEEGKQEEAERWRARLLARMGDVSEYVKTLKQRFTKWYNHTHHRFGTLWAERFRSVMAEDGSLAVRLMAAYIDLNPVRAGLVGDAKDYRWSGYGEAVAGRVRAREGLVRAAGDPKEVAAGDWKGALARYRVGLFLMGSTSTEEIKRVEGEKGELSATEQVRARVRYFTQGLVLGGKGFVDGCLRQYMAERRLPGKRRPAKVQWAGMEEGAGGVHAMRRPGR